MDAAPPPAAYDQVQPGQHYVFQTGRKATLDEAIVAIDAAGLTLRLVARDEAGQVRPAVTKTIPRDVLWFMRTYRPELPLTAYETSGYDAAYFRAMMASHPYSHDPLPQDQLGREARTISGRRFEALAMGGEQLAKTTKGCILFKWRKLRAARYPFTLDHTTNDVPVLRLTAIR